MNDAIEAVIGLAGLKYLFSGKSEIDRVMDRATRPVIGSETAGRMWRNPRVDRDSLRILEDGFSKADYDAQDEADKQAAQRRALHAQMNRIEALAAKIQNFPDYSGRP